MFYYTHKNDDVKSSAVAEVYFNENDGETVIVLQSEAVYQYSGLTKDDFKELTTGRSPGTHYATKVKRHGRGRAKNLGWFDNLGGDYFRSVSTVKADRVPEAAVGTPKGLTYAEGVKETPVTTAEHRVALGVPPIEIKGAGGGLTIASGSITATHVNPQRPHKVSFTIDGGNDVKTFNVDAYSVDQAVLELRKATSALGLTANVKEVTVKFE